MILDYYTEILDRLQEYNTDISNEAINFQVSSNLGKALENLFQQIIDYREDLLINKNYHYDKTLCEKIYAYASKIKFAKQLQDIIKKEANITIKNIDIRALFIAGLSGLFCTLPMKLDMTTITRDQDRFIDISAQTSGRMNLQEVLNTSDLKFFKEYMTYLDGAIDQSTGVLKKDKPIEIYLLGFDFNMAFLSEAFTTYASSDERTTAKMKERGLTSVSILTTREITAIVMHE
ncbi:MAG: hypothetical protein LBE13_18615, partial [Bacteroidales bacterium]|nr:hypothetical protein [Bacteroidales bacterium]